MQRDPLTARPGNLACAERTVLAPAASAQTGNATSTVAATALAARRRLLRIATGGVLLCAYDAHPFRRRNITRSGCAAHASTAALRFATIGSRDERRSGARSRGSPASPLMLFENAFSSPGPCHARSPDASLSLSNELAFY